VVESLSQSLKVREIMTITNDLPELCLPTAGDRPGQQSVVEPMKILSLWCLGSKQKSHSSETPQPFAARLFSFSKPTDTVVLLRFLSLTVSESGKCISSRIHPATHATYHLMLFSTGLFQWTRAACFQALWSYRQPATLARPFVWSTVDSVVG
jgi:hypothetical protein